MSRRVVSLAVAVALVLTLIPLPGCQQAGPAGSNTKPFTTDYSLTQADYDFFVGADDVDTVIARSPFYAGNQPLPSQNTGEYEAARYKKVGDIVAEAETLVAAGKAAEPALTTLRSDYVSFLEKVRTSEPKAAEFIGSSMTSITALGVNEMLAQCAYEGLKATEATVSYTSTMRDYLKVTRATEYGSLLLEDANTIIAHAAYISLVLETDGSAGAKAAAAEFDAKAAKDVDDAMKALEPVANGIDRIDQGMALLASGDYYFSREALGWMASESTKLKPQVDALAAREDLTQERVDDVKTAYGAFQEWNGALSAELKSLDTSRLVAVEGAEPFGVMPFLGTAYAAEGDVLYNPGADYSSSIAALSKPAETKQGWLGATWSGVKTVFGAAKTGLGVTLDAAGAGVKNIATVGCGIYYGNKPSEIWKEMKDNVKVIGDNYKNGVSGSTIISTAGGYLDDAETGAGETIGGWSKSGIEKTWGKGKIADGVGWATGGLTKITTGMFTGLAKGLYKVANTQSSTADVASGIVEIGLSCIGGSKVLIKGTQVPGLLKGGYNIVKNAKNALVNLAGSAGDAKVRGALAKEMGELIAKNNLTKEQAAKLIGNSVKVEIADLVAEMMVKNRAAYIKAIRDLIAAGGAGLKTNFAGGIKSSLEDLLVKGFPKTMQGFLDAGTTVIGGTLSDYIDNLVGSQLDPLLTDLINSALAIAPDPEQLDGGYAGSYTVTAVEIPEDMKGTKEGAQCAALFKQMEGKKTGMTLKLSGGASSASMSAGSGSQKGSCEYSAGSITMSFTSDGTTITFSGTAKLTKEGVSLGGTFSAPYQKTKIIMRGTWSAAKK